MPDAEAQVPAQSSPDPRLGAVLAFGALCLLSIVAVGSLMCAWRQRALKREKDRKRWGALIAHFSQTSGDNLASTTESLLHSSTGGADTELHARPCDDACGVCDATSSHTSTLSQLFMRHWHNLGLFSSWIQVHAQRSLAVNLA